MSSPPPPPNWYAGPSDVPAPGSGSNAAPSRKRRGALIAGGIAGALVVLGVIGNVDSDKDQPSLPAGTTTTKITTAISTTTPTSTPVTSTETPASSHTVIVGPPGYDESTGTDVPPPVAVPTAPSVPQGTVPQTTYELVPSVPAVAPFRSCAAARAAGAAPVYRGDPGYSSAIDRDRDGVACEGG